MPISAFFKKFRQFFQITNLLSRKSQAVERFQFSWEIMSFETQAGIKMPRLSILEKNRDLFKDNICFSKQTKNLIVLRIPKQYESLTRNFDEKCQIVLLKSFKDIFAKKKSFFFQKNSSFEILEIAWAIITFGKHSEGKNPCLVFMKTFKYSFEKKTSLFPKNPKFWTSSKHMTNCKFRDVFEKKTCEIKCFWKFQNVFSSDQSIFPKKAKFWKLWEFSGSEYFGTYSRWK